MTRRTAGVLLATAIGMAFVWLFTGTQAALPELASGEQGWSGDFRSFYLPNAEYLGSRLARGEIPLWNPHQGIGAPFLATLQPGVLYPPNWLHALLPVQTTFLLLAALHVGLAAFLAGALAHALGSGAAGSALAGVAYASSMQMVGSIWSPPVLYTAAWAPGLLWAVDRCIEAPSGPRVAALAAALGLPLLAGWPYTVAIAGLGCALYGGMLLGARSLRTRRAPVPALLALALGVVCGVLLASPQLLPSAELLERSCRALGSLVEGQALGGGVVRPYEPANFWARLLHRGFNDGVPGWLALTLAALAVALPGPGRARSAALLAVGAFGLLASFPNHSPVYGWLRELPLFSDFRFPFRYRMLPTLAIATTAGVGAGHLGLALARWPRTARALGVALVAGVLVSAALPAFRGVLPFARSWPVEPDLAAQVASRTGFPWQPDRPPGGRSRIFWARRADKLRHPTDVDAIHDLEPLTLARTAQMLTFFETGRPLTLLTLPDVPARPGRPPGDTLAPPFFGFVTLPQRPGRARILDLLSVDTLVADSPPAWLDERYRRVSPGDADSAVFRNPASLPRAYRAAAALPEPESPQTTLATLLTPRLEPRALALLDTPPPELLARPGRPVAADTGSTEVVSYEPERVRIRTRGDAAAAVVLTDAHFPGWEATLDGSPVPILRANFGVRAVAVPPGAHEIEMRYRPPRFRLGIGLAALALALSATLAWRDPWRR